MLDVEQLAPDSHQTSLAEWVNRAIKLEGVALCTQLQGNNLHIICESSQCPNASLVLPKLLLALKTTDPDSGLPTSPEQPISQIILYGRAAHSPVLEWVETIDIHEVDRLLLQWLPRGVSLAAVSATPSDVTAPPSLEQVPSWVVLDSEETLVPSKNPEDIAREVAQSLSFLGGSVKVSIQNLLTKLPLPLRRLRVICNCDSCPSEPEIAEAVATKLRSLTLEGFSDAFVRFQVQKTHWMLRVDLTPAAAMVEDWARWGDVEALSLLLNQSLAEQGMAVRAVLKDITLHLFCSHSSSLTPDNLTAISVIAPKLEHLAPAGIAAAVVYGVSAASPYPMQESPVWIEWLHLPASKNPSHTPTPRLLAQQLDVNALIFLLQRLLNPSIGRRLATGGIHVTLRRKRDLLHIMTEATACPQPLQVTKPIAKLLQSLKIPGITGVRVYGRRAGESSPAWQLGFDLQVPYRQSSQWRGEARNFIPQSDSPTLSVSDALKGTVDGVRSSLQQWLCSTHLFIPSTETLESPPPRLNSAKRENYSFDSSYPQALQLCIWGTVGLLLTIQTDFLLGHLLKSSSENSQRLLVGAQHQVPLLSSLATSAAAPSPTSSLNNRLLDEKLALYKQACATDGSPDILIVGSSRAMRGVDPQALKKALKAWGYEDVKIFNFGINGATAQVVDLLVRRILTPSQLPKLIIWADGVRAFNSGSVDTTYKAIAQAWHSQPRADTKLDSDKAARLEETEKPHSSVTNSYQAVDRWLNQSLANVSSTYPQRDRLTQLLQQQYARVTPFVKPSLAAPEYSESQENMTGDGFLPVSIRFHPTTYYQHHARVSGDYDSDYESFYLGGEQEEALLALLEFVKLHQIPLVFVNLPLTDDYLDPVRQEYETQFQWHMEQLASQNKLIFLDMSRLWSNNYDYFSDPSHLNRYGADAVSNYLATEQMIPWVTGLVNTEKKE